MRVRMALLAMAVCAAVAAAPATAGAQEPPSLTKVVPVTGKSKSGKKFRGTYAIDRFKSWRGRGARGRHSAAAWATVGWTKRGVGDARGGSDGRGGCAASRRFRVPARFSTSGLGPINLDLLGLVVRGPTRST